MLSWTARLLCKEATCSILELCGAAVQTCDVAPSSTSWLSLKGPLMALFIPNWRSAAGTWLVLSERKNPRSHNRSLVSARSNFIPRRDQTSAALFPTVEWLDQVFDLGFSIKAATDIDQSVTFFFLWAAGYAEAQFRQYQRLTKQIRPDLDSYEKQREE